MRNKRLLWMLVMVILVVSSVMVEAAIGDRLRGITGRIGGLTKGIGVHYILINSVLIGVFLFILATLLGGKFFEAKGKTAKGVFVVALVILSVYFAFQLGNEFVWSQNVVKDFWNYLFDEKGILRSGERLFVFIGASLLFSWLFLDLLQIGGKHWKVDVALAILIGADLARWGISRKMLIVLGQLIAIVLLTRRFGVGEKRNKITGGIWASGLVLWISSIVFPDVGFLGFIGIVKWVRSWGLGGQILFILGFVFIGLLGGVVWAAMKKKEKEAEEKKKERRWKEDIVAYPIWYLKRWLGKIRNPIVRWIYKRIDPKITTPEGLIPFPFRELRVEFMTLMNYMLRLEVYKAKKNYVTETQQFMDNEVYSERGLHEIVQLNKINTYLNILKNGGGFKLNKGIFEPIIKEVINERGEEEKLEAGFNSTEWFIYELINNLKREVEELTFIKQKDRAEFINKNLDQRMDRIDKYLIAVRKRWGCEKINEKTGRFTGFAMRKGAYSVLEGRRILLLDQYRHHGRYDHTYKFAKFAKKGVQIYNVSIIDQGPNPYNSELKNPPKYGGISNGGTVDSEFKYEVDTNGYFIDDLNEYIVEGINKGFIRKVKPEDVVEHDFFNDAAKWLEAEWDLFVWDVRDGRYHPNSRSAKDYNDLHALRSFNYSNVKPHSGPIGRENPAFDRQALLDIAFDYIGRKNVTGIREADVSKKNIKPCISTLGMREYILSYLEAKMKVDERFRYNLSRYAYDTGSEKAEVDVFTRVPQEAAKEK